MTPTSLSEHRVLLRSYSISKGQSIWELETLIFSMNIVGVIVMVAGGYIVA